MLFLFCKYPATTEIYTYRHTRSLHDALPIESSGSRRADAERPTRLDGSVVGHRGNEPNDPAQRARAVKGALRTDKNLGPFHIVEIEVGIGRIIIQPRLSEILPHRCLGLAVETAVGDSAND